ncbi:MAG: hypothetical protein Q6J18_02140, partial [Gloeomargarita sp. DG02_3_bins_56]
SARLEIISKIATNGHLYLFFIFIFRESLFIKASRKSSRWNAEFTENQRRGLRPCHRRSLKLIEVPFRELGKIF